MNIAVIIPTFNEKENLPLITARLMALPLPDLRVFVIDDNSPDGTGQVADALVAQYPGRVEVLHRSGKLGLGTAYITGFQRMLKTDVDAIAQMDADFSHSPEYVPQLLAVLPDYDVVVGSRYVSGGKLDERWPWWRRFLSWWANSVWVHLILGTHTRDATAGFKCWQSAALQRLGLQRINSNGYIFQVEMCYLAEKLGMRIKELPITFIDRRFGSSKMDARVQIEAALRVFEIRHRHASPVDKPAR